MIIASSPLVLRRLGLDWRMAFLESLRHFTGVWCANLGPCYFRWKIRWLSKSEGHGDIATSTVGGYLLVKMHSVDTSAQLLPLQLVNS
jgi:hypothetical protein